MRIDLRISLFLLTLIAAIELARQSLSICPSSPEHGFFQPDSRLHGQSCSEKLDQLEHFFDSKKTARQKSSYYMKHGLKEDINFFDKFEPEAVCIAEERFGGNPNLPRHDAFGDGPKFMCGIDYLKSKNGDCLVYSVGSYNDIQFEESTKKHLGCEIHTFDPTVLSHDFVGHNVSTFHPWGLGRDGEKAERGEFSWHGQSLQTIVGKLEHTNRNIDVFKIDCEGCEWKVMPDIFKDIQKGLLKIDQIQVEMHNHRNRAELERLFEGADAAGMRLFHKERNGWGCEGYRCVEYAFASSAFSRKVNKHFICS